jgi:hypothetical protein
MGAESMLSETNYFGYNLSRHGGGATKTVATK